ncbi:MAG: F0F1 ATP synthase subunit A [Clostridiales bacterium]
MHESGVLFHIGSFGVTSTMTTMLGITVLLSVVCYLTTRNLKLVPSGLQNAMEMVLETIEGFLSDLMGFDMARKYLPLLASLFFFILLSNYSGLLPLAGHLPGLAAPTSSLSVTAALAIIVFISTHYFGFKAHGLGYLKHFVSPVFFMLPFLVIEELVRPLSLSLRLYGNIFGEETVGMQFFNMMPILVPLPMMFLSLLMGLIQALVFMILASIYISSAAGEAH